MINFLVKILPQLLLMKFKKIAQHLFWYKKNDKLSIDKNKVESILEVSTFINMSTMRSLNFLS